MAAIGHEQASPVLEKRKRAKSAKKKKKDNPLSIHVLLLRPTQFNLGYTQVEKLVSSTNAQIADVKSKKELKKRLGAMNRRKKVPIIVGPGEEFYMVDHHHWVRALWESNVKFSHKQVYFYILQDLSHLTPLEFWEEMKRNKWVYLNSCGEPRTPTDLPDDITGLLDDPYRALARSVRGKHRGWRKSRLPFTEFLWADYLRTFSNSFAPFVVEGEKMEAKSNQKVFDLAVTLCRSDAAALLPGYIGQPAAKENEESVDMSAEV